jgi:hypothetical protein
MASNNASRQIFEEKRIVKELTIKFWFNSIQNTQAPRFLRFGERASKNSDKKALSSSALHSALCASLCSSE